MCDLLYICQVLVMIQSLQCQYTKYMFYYPKCSITSQNVEINSYEIDNFLCSGVVMSVHSVKIYPSRTGVTTILNHRTMGNILKYDFVQ